ncbi:MAG TPA: hypothetical protein VMS56_06800 [Thermoanaerobaculia bacterium]|nr:hypothetical protein [Thermoanaerobaculia bacterium]
MRFSTIVILAALLLWIAGSIAAGCVVAEAMSGAGVVEVSIADHDFGVALDVPAFPALLVLRAARLDFGGVRVHVREDLHEWAGVVRTALDEMEPHDHVTILEVRDGFDRVRLDKRGRRLVLEIDGGGSERVRISADVRTVRRALDRIDS